MNIELSQNFKNNLDYLVSTFNLSELFGVAKKSRVSAAQALPIFERVWDGGLRAATEISIQTTKPLEYEAAIKGVRDREIDRIHRNKQQRLVKYRDYTFIFQMTGDESSGYVIDDIILVYAYKSNPKLICVEMESVEEKERFVAMATRRGKDPEELLREWIRNYMTNN